MVSTEKCTPDIQLVSPRAPTALLAKTRTSIPRSLELEVQQLAQTVEQILSKQNQLARPSARLFSESPTLALAPAVVVLAPPPKKTKRESQGGWRIEKKSQWAKNLPRCAHPEYDTKARRKDSFQPWPDWGELRERQKEKEKRRQTLAKVDQPEVSGEWEQDAESLVPSDSSRSKDQVAEPTFEGRETVPQEDAKDDGDDRPTKGSGRSHPAGVSSSSQK
jgi:hypothetical protein